jgi:hypothetical protein
VRSGVAETVLEFDGYQRLAVFRKVRDEILQRLRLFVDAAAFSGDPRQE